MTGLAWAALGIVGMFMSAALGDLVSEEIRGWLDLAPRAILRLAAAELDPGLREVIYQEEWLPELIYVLRGAESRPITRLIRGSTFSLGLLFSARSIARYRATATSTEPPAHTGDATVLAVSLPATVTDQLLAILRDSEEALVYIWDLSAGLGNSVAGPELLRRFGYRIEPDRRIVPAHWPSPPPM